MCTCKNAPILNVLRLIGMLSSIKFMNVLSLGSISVSHFTCLYHMCVCSVSFVSSETVAWLLFISRGDRKFVTWLPKSYIVHASSSCKFFWVWCLQTFPRAKWKQSITWTDHYHFTKMLTRNEFWYLNRLKIVSNQFYFNIKIRYYTKYLKIWPILSPNIWPKVKNFAHIFCQMRKKLFF